MRISWIYGAALAGSVAAVTGCVTRDTLDIREVGGTGGSTTPGSSGGLGGSGGPGNSGGEVIVNGQVGGNASGATGNGAGGRVPPDPTAGSGSGGGGNAEGGVGTSSGTGGEASGENGTGGTAGPTLSDPKSCTSPANCDDGKACNGQEACVDGSCKPGTSPCVNPDDIHCTVLCQETATGAQCQVRGRDGDGDSHASSACLQANPPGDDCDDANKTVFVGALELCDGIDNDCNHLADLQDGLKLSGTNRELVSAALSPDPGRITTTPEGYGVLWAYQPVPMHLIELTRTGEIALASKELTSHGMSNPFGWNGKEFISTFSSAMSPRESKIELIRLDKDGVAPTGYPKTISSGLGIPAAVVSQAVAKNGNTLAVWATVEMTTGAHPLFARIISSATDASISDTGSTDTSITITDSTHAYVPHVAAGTAGFMVAWREQYGTSASDAIYQIAWKVLDNNFASVGTGTMPGIGESSVSVPLVTASGDGYAAIWRTSASGKLRFAQVTSTGAMQCIKDLAGTEGLIPSSIIAGPRSLLIPYVTLSGQGSQVKLLTVLPECQVGPSVVVAEEAGTVTPWSGEDSSVDIAGSPTTGYAMVWESNGLKGRAFGPNLCD